MVTNWETEGEGHGEEEKGVIMGLHEVRCVKILKDENSTKNLRIVQ